MNIKINISEMISLVVVAVYLTNAAVPYEIWSEVGTDYTTKIIITTLKFIMILMVQIPLMILYNGLKPNDA